MYIFYFDFVPYSYFVPTLLLTRVMMESRCSAWFCFQWCERPMQVAIVLFVLTAPFIYSPPCPPFNTEAPCVCTCIYIYIYIRHIYNRNTSAGVFIYASPGFILAQIINNLWGLSQPIDSLPLWAECILLSLDVTNESISNFLQTCQQ